MNATNRLEGKHVNIGAVCRQMSTMETWIQTTEAKGKRIEEKRLNEIQSMEKELKDVEKLMQSLRERYNKHLKFKASLTFWKSLKDLETGSKKGEKSKVRGVSAKCTAYNEPDWCFAKARDNEPPEMEN